MNNMRPKQELIKKIFICNLREKIFAVLCTLLALYVATCFKTVHKVYSVKVNTKISPKQILVSNIIDHVEVKVNGNFFELRKIKSEDLVINFDFSSEKAGEISVNIGEKELPSSFTALDVKSISPQTLVFRTEEKKEEPAKPVETLPETSPKEEESVETSPETSPKKSASGGKND